MQLITANKAAKTRPVIRANPSTGEGAGVAGLVPFVTRRKFESLMLSLHTSFYKFNNKSLLYIYIIPIYIIYTYYC
jgi:hypothetical protein